MSEQTSRHRLVVVIGTCNRLELLRDRALESVCAQTRRPDHLVVIDDSSEQQRLGVRELVQGLEVPGCKVRYAENARTPGASGSWNTGFDLILEEVGTPEDVFIAALDDDDAWAPDYLDRCVTAVDEEDLDMVASGLRRLEGRLQAPLVSEAPESLRAEDFLTGNPGIQGSNLFVRLSVLLAAGGFDEEQRSTIDRDLCIRIAELGTVRYSRLRGTLVDHYADRDRSRLSTPGSAAKLEGLTVFWRKFVGRMSADQRLAFLGRAITRFGWIPPRDIAVALPRDAALKKVFALGLFADRDPPAKLLEVVRALRGEAWDDGPLSELDSQLPLGESQIPLSPQLAAAEAFGGAPPHPPIQLYVGVITSEPLMLRPLLDGLAQLRSSDKLRGVGVLVLDNGSPPQELDAVVRGARRAGLAVAAISEARQRLDAAAGGFGSALRDRPHGQVGIARARTMLQRYLGAVLAEDLGSIGWILDDDMRVDARARAYLSWLPAFREAGTDVVLGACEGSSPNPPLNGLRVHLVDLLHNIHWLRSLPDDMVLPDRTAENAALRARFPDYYYDLSRKHTAHLEAPHWLEPATPGETVREAYSRLLNGAIGLLNGDPLTRPIVITPPSDPLASAKDSVNRGGSTFILNPRALTDTPNLITTVHGREARRSDMVWAIVNRHVRHMTIKAVAFPVHHLGRVNAAPSLNLEKVRGEIMGSTLYAGLTEFLHPRPQHELNFSREELDEICGLANHHLTRRWHMLKLSFARIAGLREALQRVARPGELQELIDTLARGFTPESFARLRAGLNSHDRSAVGRFLSSLRDVADDYAQATVSVDALREQLMLRGSSGSGDEP